MNVLPTRLPKGVQDTIGRTVGGLGITPNAISLFGFGGNLAAAWLIANGELLFAGIVFLFFSALDMVDGAVARATGLASPFGAVFDAVLDRASEAIVLAACGWYFTERGEQVQAASAYGAIFGSIAVSYMRARAEVAGMSMRDGLFRRQERVAMLTIGLFFNGLTVVIGLLAVLANFTALQRFWMLRNGMRE
ncbi:CDP-alcohol phosphatidyltransferase family protein [Candidatus Amarobacter glycogenicus]|uniref:CDP-alcohol phosphatidyltransferase family protein n=1 Tax=Candidatus Amarobacter glycogenicus TaxID=3140699 RepID=UPI0031CC6029